MVITFIDGMFLGNVLLEIKLANHLREEFTVRCMCIKKILFSDFLLILSVKNPAHIYLSNHIL